MKHIYTAPIDDVYTLVVVDKLVCEEQKVDIIYYDLDAHDYHCPSSIDCDQCPVKSLCMKDNGTGHNVLLKYMPEMVDSNPEFFI